MASLYGFAYADSALRFLETKVPTKIRGQIKRRVEALAANQTPPGSKKLQGIMDGGFTGYDMATTEFCIPSVPSLS